ncbi:MAG: hypothetical protein E6K41_16860 [Gammaproteobacteria bacterium]|nr:MAG: hypothetical protein E6K41_16860 [Gammaproteobacteria bacterium]
MFKNVFGPASDAENGNDWGLRGQLLFKLPDSSQLLLLGRLSRTDVHAGSWETLTTKKVASGIDVLAGPNDNPYGTCPGCNASGLPPSGPFVIRDSISGFTRLQGGGLTAKYTRDLSGTALTVIGDYTSLRKDYQEDSDASPVTLFQFFNGSKVNQESVEARLNGGDKKLNWTAGPRRGPRSRRLPRYALALRPEDHLLRRLRAARVPLQRPDRIHTRGTCDLRQEGLPLHVVSL